MKTAIHFVLTLLVAAFFFLLFCACAMMAESFYGKILSLLLAIVLPLYTVFSFGEPAFPRRGEKEEDGEFSVTIIVNRSQSAG